MKTLIYLFLMLIINLSFSQGYSSDREKYSDYLIDKSNDKISCNIKQIKNGKVKFQQEGKIYIETEDLSNFKEVKFSETDILKNTLNIKIEKPIENYSYIYFYAANDHPYTVIQD